MRDLVRHDVCRRAVAGEQCWRHKRETRVLHAAVGKAGGQQEEVVLAPAVGAGEGLGGGEVVEYLKKG